jgi:type VI protein secretion system component Hcp
MDKKKSKEPKPNSVEDLPAKTVDPKGGEAVKGGDRAKGAVDHSSFTIMKLVDKASPKIYE